MPMAQQWGNAGNGTSRDLPRHWPGRSVSDRTCAIAFFVVLAGLFVPVCVARGAEAAHSHNFIVLAPNDDLARAVLSQAELFRDQVAEELFGSKLPPNVGPAIIHLELSDTEDRGTTWVVDHPDRKYHRIWLVTSRKHALGGTLRHEITHVVLATRFPKRLPKWAEEGMASLSDDPARRDTRQSVIDWYAETDNWPDLARTLKREIIDSHDVAAYSVAASVTDYLLSLKDTSTFVAFAAAARKDLNAALNDYFGLRDVDELQARWQR